MTVVEVTIWSATREHETWTCLANLTVFPWHVRIVDQDGVLVQDALVESSERAHQRAQAWRDILTHDGWTVR